MRLFHSPTSPYVRKVMVLLHETGLLPRVELVAAQGTPVDPGSMPVDRNPLGKIPALDLLAAGATLLTPSYQAILARLLQALPLLRPSHRAASRAPTPTTSLTSLCICGKGRHDLPSL